jgi:hypothetical protein
VADAAVVRAGGTVRIRVTDNDADAKGATVTLPEQPADGTRHRGGRRGRLHARGRRQGTTRFDYALAVDGEVRSTATVTVTVVPAPSGTLAIDDHASTPVNTGGDDGVLVFVLDNDVEAGQADVVVTGDPGHGTATALNTCGGEICLDPRIRYVPDEGFSGRDTFRYGLRVDGETVDTATVTVDVTGDSESGPRTVDDTVTVRAGGSVTFFPTANDRSEHLAPRGAGPALARRASRPARAARSGTRPTPTSSAASTPSPTG